MTNLQLIDNSISPLQLQDSIDKALQMMHDLKLTHLPITDITDQNKFLGLISEVDLLSEKNKIVALANFQDELIPASVNAYQHFLKAVSIGNLYQTNLIPVVNDNNEYMGAINGITLLAAIGNFCGTNENGALVVLNMERNRFAISEINSIVESDDASILHLNITPFHSSDLLEVTLQINKREISTIIATFERYGYTVSYFSGEEIFENEISSNYQNLMNFLDI